MKNLLLITFSSLTIFSYSQKSNQLSFSIGSAIPLANFQKTDINDVNSGYAKNGRTLKIMYAKRFANQISLQFTFIDILNKMDNQSEIQAYINTFPTTKHISVRNRVWNNTSILFGVSKRINFSSNRFGFEPAISAGYTHVIRPELFISNHIEDAFIAQSENESTSSSLSILFSLSNYYKINDQFSLFVALEYFATSLEFDFTRYPITDKNLSFSPQDISYTQDIRLFMTSGGLSFSF